MKRKLIDSDFYILLFCFIIFRSPEELYTEFKPTIPLPEKIKKSVKKSSINYSMSPTFEEYINTCNVDKQVEDVRHIDFYEAYKNNL